MEKLRVDVWSDIACPWCWVGKRRLETALAQLGREGEVEVVWRAFELDPGAPAVRDDGLDYAEQLGKKYGTSAAQAKLMIQRMTDTAAADGLEMRFDIIQTGNTFDAHRLLHMARERDLGSKGGLQVALQDALKERLFRAYLGEGARMSDHATLLRLAGEVGVDVDEASGVLASDTFAREVRADEREAASIGVSGVPFFMFAGRLAVSGAQPAEAIAKVLERAWAETARPVLADLGEGAACGPAGCD